MGFKVEDDDDTFFKKLEMEMKNSGNLVRDQRYHGRKYYSCFRGDEAIQWFIQSEYAHNESEALRLGNRMFNKGYFAHVYGDHSSLKNERLFYRFASDGGSSGRDATGALRKLSTVGSSYFADDDFVWNGRLERMNQDLVEKMDKIVDSLNLANETNAERHRYFSQMLLRLMLFQIGNMMLIYLNEEKHGYATAILITLAIAEASRFYFVNGGWLELPSGTHQPERLLKPRQRSIMSPSGKSKFVETEKVEELRKQLLDDMDPYDSHIFSDTYLATVLSQPNSKGTGIRTFEYSATKLKQTISLRNELQCSMLPVCSADLKKAPKLQAIVQREHYLYWLGYDYRGHPILWVRPAAKNWERIQDSDIQDDLKYHAMMLDIGLRFMMPEDQSQFVIIADGTGLGPSQFHLEIIKKLIHLMSVGYPDRISRVIILPAPFIARGFFKIISPFLSSNLLSKISICNMKTGRSELKSIMDEELIPPSLGGGSEKHSIASDIDEQIRFQADYRNKLR